MGDKGKIQWSNTQIIPSNSLTEEKKWKITNLFPLNSSGSKLDTFGRICKTSSHHYSQNPIDQA